MGTDTKSYDMPVVDAAEQLGVSTKTVKRWLLAGKIDGRKNFSGKWLLNRDDVAEVEIGTVTER